jgi:Virulence factor membrane-bound polymerase, C-terminal/O-Antigen ligase/Protein glycosylation ligase
MAEHAPPNRMRDALPAETLPRHDSPAARLALIAVLCTAVGTPTLLAYNQPPSPTVLNQICAIGGWGLAIGLLALLGFGKPWREAWRRTALLQASLASMALAALWSWLGGELPAELALPAVGTLAAASVVLAAGAGAKPGHALWAGLFAALLAVGVASAIIGVIQVFAPDALPHQWIARSGIPGRAVGNLRQPNHLSTLLLWSAVAAVPLLTWTWQRQRRALSAAVLATAYVAVLFGVVLSGSRTGLLGVGVLVLWGLMDRSLVWPVRALLISSPLFCMASALSLNWWSAVQRSGALGVVTRLGESDDISGARFAIWRDTLALIAQNPWFGVGFGEFNFAWTLTTFADRNPQFFDHTHNLPLYLAVELGIPLALLVLGLLSWGLWQAFKRSAAVDGLRGVERRAALVIVLLMALHSQLEYPLWYAYFLLPTAFAWGLCLGGGDTPREESSSWIAVAGVVLMLAATVAVWDYRRVVAIFSPPIDSTETLAERIVEGRHSWFFAHHADYALVTTIDGAGTLPGVFDRSTHFLLDTRLMTAWANGLAAQGDVERARYIAARLREFRNPNSKDFFAPCDDTALVDKPFQCTPPTRAFTWRDFR